MTRSLATRSRRLWAILALSTVGTGNALAADEMVGSDVARATATVDAIDQTTRVVTLREANGKTVTFVADDGIKNLAQVVVGDKVTFDYAQAVIVQLDKSAKTVRERAVSQAIERSPAGAKPGGIAVRQVRVVASVEAIDRNALLITLRGAENTVQVKVRDASMLSNLDVGDFVEAVYGEALMIKVQSAAK